MKSVKWPINWTYDGDIAKAKEFHGEGRALLGQLKNMTYGGANLGSNRLRKKYADGVVVTANILPGIDKVHIFVPEHEEGGKPEEGYQPYLWVGAKIVSGGLFRGDGEDTSVDPWNYYDFSLNLNVWEPPQDDKKGQDGNALEPNQIQHICTWRQQQQGFQPWLCSTSDCYPIQEDRYWQDDPTVGFGGQAYMKRINMTTFGIVKYPSGPSFSYDALNFEHTDDNLMSGGHWCPYDPLWNGNGDDDEHIWEFTAWCDPLTSKYTFENGPPPIKTARGIVPSGAKTGGIITYPNPDNTWNEFYDPDEGASGQFADQVAGDISEPLVGRIIPGQYIVKVMLRAGSECPPFDLPVKVEIEARVGHPAFGKYIVVNETVTINANPAIANYICNMVPYGYYRETHLSTGEIDRFGDPVPDGYGPNPHSAGAVWQGAFLIDAFTGSISFVENFDFSDIKDDYKLESYNTVWPSSNIDYPFGSSQVWEQICYDQPCLDNNPCVDRLSAYQLMKAQGKSVKDGEMEPWVEYVVTGSSGPFTYADDYAKYLLGRKARVVCTWFGLEGNPLDTQKVLFTSVLYSTIQICDDEYPNYNGEIWYGLQYGILESEELYARYWDHNMFLGEEVYIIYPQANDVLRIIPVTYEPTGLLRAETADFDNNVDTPDGY